METEAWMCRICLGQGRYSIFDDHLLPPQTSISTTEEQQKEETSTAIKSTTTVQGRNSQVVAIVDALNYFCEFKISPPETVTEPSMLCEGCCAALLQAYQFRIKLNEAEQTLRSRDSLDTCSTKTGLTLQLDEIEPFLDEPSPAAENATAPAKPPKIHHAKPRFQLTNQVSNILRHVAASSEKRKETTSPDSSTPKKILRRNEDDDSGGGGDGLNRTLIVPNYVFESGGGSPPSESSESEQLSNRSVCQHCRKAFTLPNCLKHLPADRNRQLRRNLRRTLPAKISILKQVPSRQEAIPATGVKEPSEGNK